jgi:hypothetical protein
MVNKISTMSHSMVAFWHMVAYPRQPAVHNQPRCMMIVAALSVLQAYADQPQPHTPLLYPAETCCQLR